MTGKLMTDCPACQDRRRHTAEETKQHHPEAGGGYTKELGWTANIPAERRFSTTVVVVKV